MRFTVAWANVLVQNISLKFVALLLTIVSVSLTIAAVRMAFRDPLIIERGCATTAIDTTSNARSTSEIEVFLKEALAMRFNTGVSINMNFFSSEEVSAINAEQKELAQRSMSQKVIVNSIKVDGAKALIDCDRLVSVGTVRSVLPFTLNVNLSTDSRSKANPYGLIISHVAVNKTGDHK